MVKCAIEGCKNYQGKRQTDNKIRFLCFPKDFSLCQKWYSACGDGPMSSIAIARICSEHFTEGDWMPKRKRLKKGAVPTQNLHQEVYEEITKQNDVVIDEAVTPGIPINFSPKNEQTPKRTKSADDHLARLEKLRLDNQTLKLKVSNLLQRVQKTESSVADMAQIFTKGQIKRLQNPQKNCNWEVEDMAFAISLYTSSQLLYQMLWKKKYPLPSPSTLRKWAATLKLRPGMIASTLKSLSECSFITRDRLCILAFYEIRLKAPQHSDEMNETGLRPYKFGQVFIVRGLLSEWKHIIYYNFDCMMPKLVLQDIIQALKDINFTVVAIISGVGPRKLALWKALQIDEVHPSFELFEGEKVFFFANVPHLIKRLRDHFLSTGFELNGTPINVDPLKKMLKVQPSQLWVSHDLTQTHISPKRIGRHNLQMALQLFSKSVAAAIRKCVAMGKMYSVNASKCSDFIQVVDEWFCVFNSKCINADSRQKSLAYGLALDEHNAVISSMSKLMRNLRLKGDTALQPFQKGILLNNNSLPQFFDYLKKAHNVSYVTTHNLNADDIEHSFEIRKSHAGVAHKPTPLEFRYRIRAGIMMNLSAKE